MGEYRRMRRKMERDIKKGKKIPNHYGEKELYIPTEKEVEEYIQEKINQQFTTVEVLQPVDIYNNGE